MNKESESGRGARSSKVCKDWVPSVLARDSDKPVRSLATSFLSLVSRAVSVPEATADDIIARPV
jgi:hypothetical protein